MAICLAEFLLQDDVLIGRGLRLRAAIGRSGIVPAAQKREGDGATPSGLLRLDRVLYRADRVSALRSLVRTAILQEHDGWCDAPDNEAYNKPVKLPVEASHEALWREDHLYDVIGVLDWNLKPVIPGRGSAIFLHVATHDYAPTAGCVALALDDLRSALGAGLRSIRVVA